VACDLPTFKFDPALLRLLIRKCRLYLDHLLEVCYDFGREPACDTTLEKYIDIGADLEVLPVVIVIGIIPLVLRVLVCGGCTVFHYTIKFLEPLLRIIGDRVNLALVN